MLISAESCHFDEPRGFIVVEGVNGVGKSTYMRSLGDYLKEAELEVLPTCEPGGTVIGQSIRELLLNQVEQPLHHLTELFLFAADRSEHVKRLIHPALREGTVVLSDRYYYSTTAFQGYGRQLDLELVHTINSLAIHDTFPDLIVLLDLDAQEGLLRARKRTQGTEGTDSFEAEELAFHRRLRQGFLEIAKLSREPFLLLDATCAAKEVFKSSLPVIDNWIASYKASRK